MTRLPAVTGQQLLSAQEKVGFEVVRVRGSHLRHRDGRATVVPVHTSEDIGRGLLSKILRATRLSRQDLVRHL